VTVDEMDLVRQLKDAEPLRTGAYQQARTMLRVAMAEAGPSPEIAPVPVVIPLRRGAFSGGRNRRGTLGARGRACIGAGIGVAAAAAIALVVTSPAPPAGPAGAAAKPPAVQSRLISLAALIKASGGALPGNASLVIRTQTIGSRTPEVTWNLYTDRGDLYVTDTKKALPAAIARHDNLADGSGPRQVAAARYAVAGDLTTARERMVDATTNPFGLGLSPAAQKAAWDKAVAANREIYREKGIPLPKRPTGQARQDDINNYVWNNSVDALTEGAGNPQVRAGVLRLLSTIPEVTVASSATGGQPTLTLTAGSALFGGGSPQVLTVNARTGMPISSVMDARGNELSSVTSYQVTRVSMADIEAGKF
jgi:hypothetical protein